MPCRTPTRMSSPRFAAFRFDPCLTCAVDPDIAHGTRQHPVGAEHLHADGIAVCYAGRHSVGGDVDCAGAAAVKRECAVLQR